MSDYLLRLVMDTPSRASVNNLTTREIDLAVANGPLGARRIRLSAAIEYAAPGGRSCLSLMQR